MADKYTVYGGSLLDPYNWNNGEMPSSGDNVEIRHACTIGAQTFACNVMVIADGASLSVDLTDGGCTLQVLVLRLYSSTTCLTVSSGAQTHHTLSISGPVQPGAYTSATPAPPSITIGTMCDVIISGSVTAVGDPSGSLNTCPVIYMASDGTLTVGDVNGGAAVGTGSLASGVAIQMANGTLHAAIISGGNGHPGGGHGGDAVHVVGANVIITATGVNAGSANNCSNGGHGIVGYTSWSSLTVTNSISAGEGSYGGDVTTGGTGGHGVYGTAPATVAVGASVLAGAGGLGGYPQSGGAGGHGIYFTGAMTSISVTVADTISGGLGGRGRDGYFVEDPEAYNYSGGTGGQGGVGFYCVPAVTLVVSAIVGGAGGEAGIAAGNGYNGGTGGGGGMGLVLNGASTLSFLNAQGGAGGVPKNSMSDSYGGSGGNGGTAIYTGQAVTVPNAATAAACTGGAGAAALPWDVTHVNAGGVPGAGGDGWQASGNIEVGAATGATFAPTVAGQRANGDPGLGIRINPGIAVFHRSLLGANSGKVQFAGTPQAIDVGETAVIQEYAYDWLHIQSVDTFLANSGSLFIGRIGQPNGGMRFFGPMNLMTRDARFGYADSYGTPTVISGDGFDRDYPAEVDTLVGTSYAHGTLDGAMEAGGLPDYPDPSVVERDYEYADGDLVGEYWTTCDYPLETDVREGIDYANNTLHGAYYTTCDYPLEDYVRSGVDYANNTMHGAYDSECDYPDPSVVAQGVVYAYAELTGEYESSGLPEMAYGVFPRQYRFTVLNNTNQPLAASAVKVYLNRWKIQAPPAKDRYNFDIERTIVVNAAELAAGHNTSSDPIGNTADLWEGGDAVAEVTAPQGTVGSVKIYADPIMGATPDAGGGQELASFTFNAAGTQRKSFKL